MVRWLVSAGVALVLATGGANAQGLDLLGVDAGPQERSWGIACAWTAREKRYQGLNVGECMVTKAFHLPDQADHWVEQGKTWDFCANWMSNAGVAGW